MPSCQNRGLRGVTEGIDQSCPGIMWVYACADWTNRDLANPSLRSLNDTDSLNNPVLGVLYRASLSGCLTTRWRKQTMKNNFFFVVDEEEIWATHLGQMIHSQYSSWSVPSTVHDLFPVQFMICSQYSSWSTSCRTDRSLDLLWSTSCFRVRAIRSARCARFRTRFLGGICTVNRHILHITSEQHDTI